MAKGLPTTESEAPSLEMLLTQGLDGGQNQRSTTLLDIPHISNPSLSAMIDNMLSSIDECLAIDDKPFEPRPLAEGFPRQLKETKENPNL